MEKGKKTYQINANKPITNPTNLPMKVFQKLINSFGSKTATIFFGKPTTTVKPSPAFKELIELIRTLSRSW